MRLTISENGSPRRTDKTLDKVSSDDLAKVCARVIIRDGLTCEQERMWLRLAEPGDAPNDVLAYGMDVRTAVVPRALRAVGALYGGVSVKKLADTVVAHPDFGKTESLEAEVGRLRAENASLRAMLAEREAAE